MAHAHCFICHQSTHSAPYKFDVRIMRKHKLLGFALWHRAVFCSHACFKAWVCGKGPGLG